MGRSANSRSGGCRKRQNKRKSTRIENNSSSISPTVGMIAFMTVLGGRKAPEQGHVSYTAYESLLKCAEEHQLTWEVDCAEMKQEYEKLCD